MVIHDGRSGFRSATQAEISLQGGKADWGMQAGDNVERELGNSVSFVFGLLRTGQE